MSDFTKIQERESGLKSQLTAGQMSMIALGGAIGTGLFLGSKFAIGLAGPSVIISYGIGALVACLLMGALAEMTVLHTTSGSFGAFAEHYIHPVAGYLVRYMYWSCIVLAVGTEVTAIGEYMTYWFTGVPQWIWVVLFASVLIGANAMSVKTFGTLEYWFSTIKVFAIVGFILIGVYLVVRPQTSHQGLGNLTAGGGFLPHGLWGTWVAVVVSIFSYLSVEMIAIAAAESKDPATAVRKAFRVTIVRLFIFYIATLVLILAITPMKALLGGGSPFVTAMEHVGIPYAGGVLNVVLVIAAMSAMNSQLYISTRMLFSLSRAGDAPTALGRVRPNGTPLRALLVSSTGIAVAAVVYAFSPDRAYTFMLAVSMFGAMFTWAMIFVTHWFFRRAIRRDGIELPFRMPGFPVTTALGAFLMVAIMATTPFTHDFRMTLVFGVPFTALVLVMYAVKRRRRAASAASVAPGPALEAG